MSVIQTQKWLYDFVDRCKEKSIMDMASIQCEILCNPLKKVFPKVNPQAMQYELLNHGLFEPYEWFKTEAIVKEMEKQNIWKIIEKEYQYLSKLWNGPNVPIYIFPIKKGMLGFRKHLRKNGVAYKEAIFLFLSTELSKEEVKAMLAHEYNHVCRINHIKLAPDRTPLKDSLIIEGLGEYAVKELHGEKLLAPWTNLYPFDKAVDIWKRHFLPSLNMMGVKNHQPYLYGQKGSPFPKWIGYYIGYQIVNSYQEKNGPFKNNELYKISTDTFINGSKFPTKE
ncbi:DUF2268 domain-containing protein [Rummeliibacillus pycnus]|uniref:DUF2268 domain-containing protein n=1 Tax=Rummeliibacillus pycnus TaxID=101070 RepID=UPI0037CB013E